MLTPARRVFAAFALYSFAMGNIFPRLPDVRDAMGVQEGALGLGMIGAPMGTLISLTFFGPMLERVGYRRALPAGLVAMALLYAVAVWAPSPLWLFIALIPAGLAIGSVEMMVNLEADRVEHQMKSRIMNRAHAFWSFGFFGAGLFGALMAQLGVSPQLHLIIVAALVILGVVVLMGDYQPAPARLSTEAPAPKFAAPTGAITILVLVTMSAMLLEGASLDWSAIYMGKVFEAGPFLSGVAVAVFALAQAISRFFADGFVEKHSPPVVARALLMAQLIAALILCLSPWPWLSLGGFILMGLGVSAMFPLAMSAAAQRHDRPAAVNVAALAQTSFVIFLLAPPLLGSIGEHWGMRWPFAVGLPLVAMGFLLAGALETRAPTASR